MLNDQEKNDSTLIINFITNAIITNSNPVFCCVSLEFYTTRRARLTLKSKNTLYNSWFYLTW
jgi:hypothetical protein